MTATLQLGYLVLEVADLERWVEFARSELGLVVDDADGGSVYVRMDGFQQRFVLRRGPLDDVAAVGILASHERVLDELVDRVRTSGVEVFECSPELASERRVKRLVSFTDPGGTPVEVGSGHIHSVTPFSSRFVPGGFVTGSEGLGHAVLMVEDAHSALAFWTNAMGFELSDTSSHETPNGESNAFFLHCNPRHHSIALVQRPARSTYPRRLLHFMIEAQAMDSVGMAYDRAVDAGLNITRGLGKHPNDRMFSFYATTPSGFDYEFGWGGAKVGEDWAADHYDHISIWGHRNLGVVGTRHG